jgi:DNA polymerase I-like protein with 3'-5' exonuclease and polymerase domains
MVIFDPPSQEAFRNSLPTAMDNLRMFASSAVGVGLNKDQFLFVGLCPPLPADAYSSAARKWAHVQPYVESINDLIAANGPKIVVTMGELASRAVLGRAVAITKARGSMVEHNGRMVLPMLSPGYLARIPEHIPTFQSDLLTLAKVAENGFMYVKEDIDVHYEWREDISEFLTNRPAIMSVDTETTGLIWHNPAVKVLLVQFSVRPGHAVLCPIDMGYWPAWQGRSRARAQLIDQLRNLLEDPNIRKVGHNLKFDVHMLRKIGIELKGWSDDTQLMAFAVDENMMEKSLDECIRRWVPALAGYADEFNQTIDKSRMRDVPPEKMLPYAGGDADGALRLFMALDSQLRRDPKQAACYRRIIMPAIKVFGDVVERHGMLIDQDRLRVFGAEVANFCETEFDKLISTVPAKVRRNHLAAGKELKFSRTDFVRDTLFSKEGFNLTPVVFTKTTASLPEDQREASTSTKDHLPYFTDLDGEAGDFVRSLIDYQKSTKLLGTFIGSHNENTGLWQYIAPNGRIYPSYKLHVAVTGRTASSDPNGQNFPKRGRWAKGYQTIFRATPGYKLINCDLSQIELRIAAWMANDPVMLSIYRQDGDIHTATAKIVAGLTDEQWDALSPKERKELRTKAKAVNFGFLYGMGWKKFRSFARTDYGVKLTEREAQLYRERFFATYRALPAWHSRMREQVQRHGMVRALHGAVRHLPSIRSNDEIVRSGAERQAINSPVQRFGSDLGLMAMIRFSRQADPDLFRIIGFVHDALVLEVKDGHEEEGISALLYAMENPPLEDWFGIAPPLPIKAEADIGLNGGEMLELAELPSPEKWPDWFRALNLPVVEREGKLCAAVLARRPSWWREEVDGQLDEEVDRYLRPIVIG